MDFDNTEHLAKLKAFQSMVAVAGNQLIAIANDDLSAYSEAYIQNKVRMAEKVLSYAKIKLNQI